MPDLHAAKEQRMTDELSPAAQREADRKAHGHAWIAHMRAVLRGDTEADTSRPEKGNPWS